MGNIAESLITLILGSFYIMLSYHIIPPIINAFVGNSAFGSVVYLALFLTWVVAGIVLPIFKLYKVYNESNLLASIVGALFSIIIVYFGYWLLPNFINAPAWSGTNGTIAKIILWIGWILFLLGSIIYIPIYKITVAKKENRWTA